MSAAAAATAAAAGDETEDIQDGVLRAGQGLLWTAASLGNMADIEGLVSMKCALDAPNPHEGNTTPLAVAARRGHFDAVQFLLRKGANVLCVNSEGQTALHAAAAEGCLQVVKYLAANTDAGLVLLKDAHGQDAEAAAAAASANLVQRFLAKFKRDPKACGLAPDKNLRLARLARAREARSAAAAAANSATASAPAVAGRRGSVDGGRNRQQPMPPPTTSRRRAATAPGGIAVDTGRRGAAAGAKRQQQQKKRGVFGLRDLPASSPSESPSSSASVSSEGGEEDHSDEDEDDGESSVSSFFSGGEAEGGSASSDEDDSVSVGESGAGMLDGDDMDDMGLALPDSPTRDRAFMLARIDESMIAESVRAAARKIYLTSYSRWRKGKVPRPYRLEEAIDLGRAAAAANVLRAGGGGGSGHGQRKTKTTKTRKKKKKKATTKTKTRSPDGERPGKKNTRPSIYRIDGSLTPGAVASARGKPPSNGGGGGGGGASDAYRKAEQDAAWASLGRETTLDTAAQMEFLKSTLRKEKGLKVGLRRQLKELQQQKVDAESAQLKSAKKAALLAGNAKSLEAEVAMLASELSFRKAQNLSELTTPQLRDLHDNMKSALEAVAKEVIGREVAEKMAANATREEEDKQLCVICCTAPKTVLLLPCRHLCLCNDCVDELTNSDAPSGGKCPMCREQVKETMKVFS